MNEYIIFTLLVILVLLITYFNLSRYILLHIDDENKYITGYQKLPNAYKDYRVVISLSTTKNKMKKIKPVIKSLLDQTVKVDQIVLNIPETDPNAILNGEIKSEISNPDLEKMVNIYTSLKDYGPGTKFIPTMLREKEGNTILILLNDSHIYGQDFIQTLIEESVKYPTNAIYTKEAILIRTDFIDTNILKSNKKVINDDWILNYLTCEKRKIKYSENLKCLFYMYK